MTSKMLAPPSNGKNASDRQTRPTPPCPEDSSSNTDLHQQKYQSVSAPYRPGMTKKEVLNSYAAWHDYDKTLNSTDYLGPRMAAELVNEYVKDKQARILDVAAGTGLVGIELKSFSFDIVDCLEPSPMMETAKERKLYREYYSILFGLHDESRSVLKDESYDCVVSSGAYGENHLGLDSLEESLRVLRPGGICIIAMREAYLDEVEAYRGLFKPHLKQLESAGLCKILLQEARPNYFVEKTGAIFVFQKPIQ